MARAEQLARQTLRSAGGGRPLDRGRAFRAAPCRQGRELTRTKVRARRRSKRSARDGEGRVGRQLDEAARRRRRWGRPARRLADESPNDLRRRTRRCPRAARGLVSRLTGVLYDRSVLSGEFRCLDHGCIVRDSVCAKTARREYNQAMDGLVALSLAPSAARPPAHRSPPSETQFASSLLPCQHPRLTCDPGPPSHRLRRPITLSKLCEAAR